MKKSRPFHYYHPPYISKPLRPSKETSIQGLWCEGLAQLLHQGKKGAFSFFQVQNMEQRKMSNSHENYSSSNSVVKDEDGYKGVPIHSQVMKIKREFEKIKHPSPQQADMRREITRQRSRSPLGLAERPISVGNS
ncbi:hypothetical protein F3Y22_tig00110114pilonHSYRG00543 [Hibiscus syriacus]|uniref:Uncharacterized protein n=1 Tax=Hibiscus syriacus TaxID=106335 RepID=A0A6A3BP43_HIBSY|nr:hypothetical protein F3Y22_tig00110114pilonHSYRG00543 [Hibiscus syriacus]